MLLQIPTHREKMTAYCLKYGNSTILELTQEYRKSYFRYCFVITWAQFNLGCFLVKSVLIKNPNKLIVSLWVSIARHTQGTQKDLIAISLQYLKENMKNDVDFLPVDKHQWFLQIGTIILVVCDQACPNYPK